MTRQVTCAEKMVLVVMEAPFKKQKLETKW